jgi:hypothetical protein
MATENVLPYEEIVNLNKPDEPSFTDKRNIYFTNQKIPYKHFFYMNGLLDKKYEGYEFIVEGRGNKPVNLKVIYDFYKNGKDDIQIIEDDKYDVSDFIIQRISSDKSERFFMTANGVNTVFEEDDIIVKLIITKPDGESKEYVRKTTGGRKASVKKEICGRMRCIYKIQGSRKEHIKYKGRLITVADYKRLMKKA